MRCAFTGLRLIGLVLVLTVSGPARAQTTDAAFFALQRALGLVEERAEREPAFVAQVQLASLRARVGRLQDAANSLPEGDRAAYAGSLLTQANLLGESSRQPDMALARSQLADATADLEIKDEARGAFGLGEPLLGHVRVGVFTVQRGHRVGGLVVGADSIGNRGASPEFRFPRLSTASAPTIQDLPPGNYNFMMFSEQRRVGIERVQVGRHGEADMTFDLVAR
jgi:hypothetical protein